MAATSAELTEQLTTLRIRHDEAENQAAQAREHHGRLRGLAALGEASPPELAEAGAIVASAQDEAEAVAHGVAILSERLRRAKEAEREQQLANDVKQCQSMHAALGKFVDRLDRQLSVVESTATEIEHCVAGLDAHYQGYIARVLEEREERLDRDARADWERKRLIAPDGQVADPNTHDLQWESKQKALRSAVRKEADELFARPDPDALDDVRAKHQDLIPTLIGSELRRVFAEADEFLNPPEIVRRGQSFVGSTSRRIYSDVEGPLAEARFSALVDTIRRLRGSTVAPSIGQLSNAGVDGGVAHL